MSLCVELPHRHLEMTPDNLNPVASVLAQIKMPNRAAELKKDLKFGRHQD
jgi:hypothetical protein